MNANPLPRSHPPPAWRLWAACLAGVLACGAAWAQQVATLPGSAGPLDAPRSPAAPVRPVQLPQGGLMLERTDVVLPVPGMPAPAASAPVAKSSLASATGLAPASAITPPRSAPVPAERLAQRAGVGGNVVLVRTDELPPAGAASAPRRRVVTLPSGELPISPEPDVLYRLPER